MRRRGFTLVEVLVALVIVSIALAAGFKAAGSLTNNALRLADVSAAQWCADNQLANLKLPRPPNFPGVGDSDFACEQLGQSYIGKLQVRPTPNPNFRRVDARVTDGEGFTLVTISAVLPRY
jgi:general secretion pathway protein I